MPNEHMKHGYCDQVTKISLEIEYTLVTNDYHTDQCRSGTLRL